MIKFKCNKYSFRSKHNSIIDILHSPAVAKNHHVALLPLDFTGTDHNYGGIAMRNDR